ncbi:MAG: 5-(carboxyamino)imidazole ribonucleotide mutase [Clostridia bacterium]|nr:5-(carboxyamino)imidazole ribonucleotide mutase [Clostridia bacterium]
MKKVAIVMGSKNDASVVNGAYEALKKFGVPTEVRVLSAHRTPKEACDFASNARANDFGVIICAAGKAAHLAGVMAAHTSLPIIGLPIKSSFEDGLDSLLSTVQMPSGVPVATVGVNAGENAGLLAIQMLAIENPMLTKKLDEFKQVMAEKILNDDKQIMSEFN